MWGNMNLLLVKADESYQKQITEMMDEWIASGEKIVPKAIADHDYHDFEQYCQSLDVKEATDDMVPSSTYFCLDKDRNIIVGAVNIRHYLNERLLRSVGHIGDGIRPSERRKGYGSTMIALALEKCREMHIPRVMMACDRNNIASARSIMHNGGILENEVKNDDGVIMQRYWIDLTRTGE